METRLAMGCSFAMVLGLGGFELLDLDTPLLLSDGARSMEAIDMMGRICTLLMAPVCPSMPIRNGVRQDRIAECHLIIWRSET